MNEDFNHRSIGDLDDGVVGKVIDAALQEALDDCDRRPSLDSARKVMITLSITPQTDDERPAMKAARVEASVRVATPPRKANADFLKTTLQGSHVHAQLPDNRQDGMFQHDSEGN